MILLLKLFIDVIPKLKDAFTYRIDYNARVLSKSIQLWKERGYEPSEIGVSYVKFDSSLKEYVYPALAPRGRG